MKITENNPLKKLFSCPICLSFFENPTNLSCGHTFCVKCISETFQKQQTPGCPICRKPFFKFYNEELITDDLLIEIQRLLLQFDSEIAFRQEFQQIVVCLDCGLNPNQPVILSCQHLFCRTCLAENLKNDLICPACNEWAVFMPGRLFSNTKYLELLFLNDKMEEEKQEQIKISTFVSGMPVFFFDEQVCIGQQSDLLFIEQRYQQLIKISTNGSGHFPIISLIEGERFYGNLVTINNIKILQNKNISAQLKGYKRIVVNEIYTYNQAGQKIQFTCQLWISNFEIMEDTLQDEENILFLWNNIKNVLQIGFNGLNNQLKELFFPVFQLIRLTKDKQQYTVVYK